jgi:hypothetical protein
MAVALSLSDLFTGFAEGPAMADPTRSQLTSQPRQCVGVVAWSSREHMLLKTEYVPFSGPGIVQHSW